MGGPAAAHGAAPCSDRVANVLRIMSGAVRQIAAGAAIALAFLATGATEVQAQSPDWSAMLMVPSFPSPSISEWERNPQSLVLHVTYTGQAARDYRIEGSLRGLGRGELVRAESPLLTVEGGPTTEILNTADLFDWQLSPAQRGDVEELLRTGVMPEGDYEICVRLFSASDLQLAEECAPVTITNPERPELIFPVAGDPVTVSQPTFQWTPVTVPPALGVTYRVRIVERRSGQAAQTAITANRPHFEEDVTGAPMLLYPVDALPLEEGKEYVWRVEALDGMGEPLAAGGLHSELWTFTYNGLGDAVAGIDLEDGFPDEMTLIPGVARLVGLAQVETEPGPFGVTLNGRATLELDAPYVGTVPVRLQDLDVDAFGGELRAKAGRLVGESLPDGLFPEDVLGPYAAFDRLEFTPDEGLRVGGAVALPGGREVELEGDAQVTGAGVYGVLETRVGSGEPLLRLGGEPVGLRIDRARVRLPEGGLDLDGTVELFGLPAECPDVRGRLDDSGEWQVGVVCGGDMAVPLAAGGERARIDLHSAVGELGFALEEASSSPATQVAAVASGDANVALSHSLELGASLALDAGGAGRCGVNFDMSISDGEVEFERLDPRCAGGVRSDLDWLELGFSNLRIESLGWSHDHGFDFEMLVDLDPSLPQLPELRLPALHDVAVDSEGLSVPAIDESVGPLELSAAGYGVRVTRVQTPGFALSWADWEARRAGDASFGLDAELSMPRFSGTGPACLTNRAPTASAELAGGRFTLELEERDYLPGECNFALGGGLELEIEEVSGGVELALAPELSLERLPALSGELSVPELFRCPEGGATEVAAGSRGGAEESGARLAVSGVGLGPEGELSGRIEGLAPPCPLGFAGVEVELTDAALELGGDAGDRSAVLSGGGTASFAVGDEPVTGAGEIALDLIAGGLVDGELEFDGPIAFDLPREDPILSFTLGSARLDSAGLHVDGRHELTLPDGERIGTTFDHVVFDPSALEITDGRILFDASFALEVGVSTDGALSWGAVDEESEFTLETGTRVDLPDEVWVDADGLGVSGGADARLVFGGNDLGELLAEFIDDFAVRLDPVGVGSGKLEVQHEGVVLATIDEQGFHPNLAYLGTSILPEKLGLPHESVAYLELRDGEGELRVATEEVDEGIRIYTQTGQRIPFVVPALQMSAPEAPELEVGFDLTIGALGEVIDGSMEAAVPAGQASLFDLRREDVPFVVDSLVYADADERGHALMLAGRVALPGGLSDGAGAVRLEVNTAGEMVGAFAIDSDWSIDLVEGGEGLGFAFESLEGEVDIDLSTGAGRWEFDLSGALEVALGSGEPYRAAATVRAGDTGMSLPRLEAGLPDVFSYFDLGGVALGIGNLTVPHLEYEEASGWDFEVGFDLALDFPEMEGLTLPAVPDVRLGPGGFTIPDIQIPELSLPSFELAGFALRPLAFRMDSLHLDPLGGELPGPEDWGFSFDFELGFGELGDGVPSAISNLKLSVLDAGFSGGRVTGTVETRTLSEAIPFGLGDGGMTLHLTEFGGSLRDVDGEQRIAVSASASWTPPEFLRCSAAGTGATEGGASELPAASLTLDGAAGMSGRIADFVPDCPVQIGPLALQALESELVFAAGSEGQAVELEMEGRLELPGLAEGDTVVATGALAVDLLAPRIVRGGIDVEQTFRWGLPIENPFLDFAVTEARLDDRGFVFSGAGSVRLEEDASLGVGFDQLTFALPELAITDGSATFEGGFALDAGLANELSWAARPADSPRPEGAGLRIVVPDETTIDASGLAIRGTGAGEIALNDSLFTTLAVDFSDDFRLAFEPVAVEDGRAGFSLDETEIAYLDASGFWPGDIFGMLEVPARLGLPTEEVAYLQLRDPESDELLIETSQEEDGLRLGTTSGGAVALVVPALAAGGQAPPQVEASFDVVVDPSTFNVVSGGVSVAVSEEAESLFALDSIGLPLEVRRLAFDETEDEGYALRLDARVRLPASIDEAIVDFEDVVVTAAGLSGEALLGSYRSDHNDDDGPVTAFGTDALMLEVLGAKAVFGSEPSLELDGAFSTEFFADAEGTKAPLGFTAGVATEGVSFAMDLDALADGQLPLGVATFEPRSLSDSDRDPIAVEVGADVFRVRLGGVLRMPELNDEFAVTIDGLELGTGGVSLPDVAVDLPEEWQSFTLFGADFTLRDTADQPAVQLAYEEAVLALTLAGEIEFLENVSTFRGLRIATDGTLALEEASLLSESLTLVPGAIELDSLRIAESKLHADLAVDLPAPFDEAGKQHATLSIAPDGTVSGGGRITVLSEAAGLGGDRTQFGGDLAMLHLRYLAVELDPSKDDRGGIDLVGDVYLAGEEENRIKVGDWDGGTVSPGFRLGFNGSMEWGNIALAREFDFDFDVMRLQLAEVTAATDEEGRHAIGFSGRLSINVPNVEGTLDFSDFRINDQLSVDFSPDGVDGGSLSIAEVVELEFSGFEYSAEATTIEVPAGQMPSGESEELEDGTETIEVASYLRFGGRIEVLSMSGGVDEFLLYRTAEEGLTTLIVDNANISINGVLDMHADFRFAQTSSGFEMLLGANATLLELYEATVVGMIEHGEETRAGLFVALGVSIPLVPGTLVLGEVGGGFFYNPRQEHLDLVRQYAQVPTMNSSQGPEPGRFTGMLYAQAVIVAEQIAQGRVLLTVSEQSAQLDGSLALLSASGDLDGAKIRGEMNLAVGFTQKYAEGNFRLVADFDPIIRTKPQRPLEVGFFVYGEDAWGIYGGGSLEYLRFIEGEGDFFIGPPGFMVSATLSAGFDFWIIAVDGEIDGSVWYLNDPRELGGYMTVGVEVDLAGGVAGAEAQLRGAVLAGGSSYYVYAGALARGHILGFEKEVEVWAKVQDGDWTGGFGHDPAMDEIVARANEVRQGMESDAQSMQDAIAEGPPAPESLTMSASELSQAYNRLQGMSEIGRAIGMGFAVGIETLPLYNRLSYSPVANETNHLEWYRDLMMQKSAPTPGGGVELEAYPDSVADRVQTIVDRQAAVNERVASIQSEIMELQQVAERPWPESPVRSASFAAPTAREETDADGNVSKVLEDGPGFEIDQAAADQAQQDLADHEAETEALAQQVREQIEELEAGLEDLRDVLTATDENSVLAFSRLHADAIEMAEKQYAYQGSYVLRKQDWLEAQLGILKGRQNIVRNMIRRKTNMLRDTSHPDYHASRVDDLAHNRATILDALSGSGDLVSDYETRRSGLSKTDPWFDEQADTLGMMLWYHLADAGMAAAEEAATAEYEFVREQSVRRLMPLYARHMSLTRSYNRLYTRQAELVGTLYDLYDRFAVWLDNQEDYEDERGQVLARMDELSRDLEVPEVTSLKVSSFPEPYMAREHLVWQGSHPTGTYEHLFHVTTPEREGVAALGALIGALLGNEPDPLDGLTTNGPETYRWRYVLTPERGTTSIDRTAQFAVRGGAGYYGVRETNYQTVFKEGSGFVAPSVSETPVDDTPPTRPTVGFVGHESKATHWLPSEERIEMEWSSRDPESGVAEYEYAVGTATDTTAVRDWTSVGGRTKVAVHGLSFQTNTPHHVYVRARNGEGLWSAVGRSPELRFDPTPPTFPAQAELSKVATFYMLPVAPEPVAACAVADPLASYGSGGGTFFMGSVLPEEPEAVTPSIRYTVPRASDAESGLDRYMWRVSTDGPSFYEGPEGWNSLSRLKDQIAIEGEPLDYEQEFFLTVVALNQAGLPSEPLVTSFQIADPSAPVAPSFCAGQWSASGGSVDRALSVRFSSPALDPETGVAEYDYRVRKTSGEVVRDWGESAWRTSVSAGSSYKLPVPGLTDGESYYVDIAARNGQEMETVVSSGPVRVDYSVPAKPVIKDVTVKESLRGTNMYTVSVQLNVPNDPHSGTVSWAWELERMTSTSSGVSMQTGLVPWSQATINRSVGGLVNLQPGTVYRLRILSSNGAGLTSKVSTVLFTTEGVQQAAPRGDLRVPGQFLIGGFP